MDIEGGESIYPRRLARRYGNPDARKEQRDPQEEDAFPHFFLHVRETLSFVSIQIAATGEGGADFAEEEVNIPYLRPESCGPYSLTTCFDIFAREFPPHVAFSRSRKNGLLQSRVNPPNFGLLSVF